MLKQLKKAILICFMICIILANMYVPKVEATTLGDLKDDLKKFEEDYKNNKLQKEQNQDEINKTEKEIININNTIYELGNQIEELNKEIEKLDKNIEEKEHEIEDILSFVQIANGESAYLEYAFGAQTFTDFIYRVAVSEQLTEYNDNLVNEYTEEIKQNNEKKNELAEKKVDLANRQNSLKKEIDKIKVSITELDKLSLSIEDEIEAKKAEIKIYEDKGCKNNEDIKTCGRKYLPPDTSFYRPIKEGYVTGYFGSRTCSDPRVSCYHHGVDMSNNNANYGSIPVNPIANGIVVYIATPTWNSKTNRYNDKCGGNQIFIQHNVNGVIYTSGYLHLRRIDIKLGDTVTKETQIGIIGGNPNIEYWDTCTTGAHLHLEISTGTWNQGNYYSNRMSATMYVNFPGIYETWYDKITKY